MTTPYVAVCDRGGRDAAKARCDGGLRSRQSDSCALCIAVGSASITVAASGDADDGDDTTAESLPAIVIVLHCRCGPASGRPQR
jgi:hypothetical protein